MFSWSGHHSRFVCANGHLPALLSVFASMFLLPPCRSRVAHPAGCAALRPGLDKVQSECLSVPISLSYRRKEWPSTFGFIPFHLRLAHEVKVTNCENSS